MKTPFNNLQIALRSSSMLDGLVSDINALEEKEEVEVRWGARRIPLSRGRHHGGYVCAFRGQPLLRVESALERRVIRALVAEPGCMALATQPMTIQWTWRDKVRRYTPDVLVMIDELPPAWRALGLDRLSLIEVKPARFFVDDDLWLERIRVVQDALGMPLVRLSTLPEVLS